ncbi:glycoside hydrolase family 5 protein [Urechidicola croceus]|uniref:Glycoside hydrolase n=1 Tax=Urechidicola croceus TaxID=1850246 RepID=A0A1D8P592_9FLAO|nr:glycoside hydrolase family 5 protein [Urechidicola croceus]AOW19691.1 glycoside hydrolase [Urechidicola croceus]
MHIYTIFKRNLLILSLSLFFISCESSNDTEQPINENPIENEEPIDTPEEENEEEQTYTSVVEEYGQLSVVGNKIVDQHGNPIQLRGMSLFWSQWIGKYYNQETIKWLKDDWQCTVVRAAMAIDHEGYLTNPEAEKAKVMAVVDAAIEEGIYVIIDWHDHEAENHLTESKAFFSEMAELYGDYPNVIYEPYNEPLDVPWFSVLKPYHEAVITEIRNHDPDNLVICGTRNWSQNVNEVIGLKIDDPNVAYTLHYYAATHKQELRDIATLALNNDIPLFVTEFGTTQASGDEEIDAAESEMWWNFLDQHKISWCNWSIADKEELAAALKPDASATGGWTASEITTSGTMVRNELKAKNKQY